MRQRLVTAVAASTLVVVAAPYVGQIRSAIQSALPGQYRLVIGGTIAAAVVIALAAAFVRIRERRALRYGLIAAAIGGGVIYAAATPTGNANVDVVERFHFVEYGFLTLLFYRVWNERANLTSLLYPLLAGMMIGTFDEAFQWIVPARVGEMRDVLLDGAAVACGLVFAIGLEPPASVETMLNLRTRRELVAFVLVASIAAAAFFHAVHLGHEIDGADAGRFLSRFTADELTQAARDRGVRWRSAPPAVLNRLSIEDHYLAEGLWHIQRRNEGRGLHTWKENLILERFFAPVLDVPTYSTPSGARWPQEQRAHVEASEAGDVQAYVSDANPYPIYTWSPLTFWAGVAASLAAVATVIMRAGPRHA
jgi:VanZ family protein